MYLLYQTGADVHLCTYKRLFIVTISIWLNAKCTGNRVSFFRVRQSDAAYMKRNVYFSICANGIIWFDLKYWSEIFHDLFFDGNEQEKRYFQLGKGVVNSSEFPLWQISVSRKLLFNARRFSNSGKRKTFRSFSRTNVVAAHSRLAVQVQFSSETSRGKLKISHEHFVTYISITNAYVFILQNAKRLCETP